MKEERSRIISNKELPDKGGVSPVMRTREYPKIAIAILTGEPLRCSIAEMLPAFMLQFKKPKKNIYTRCDVPAKKIFVGN